MERKKKIIICLCLLMTVGSALFATVLTPTIGFRATLQGAYNTTDNVAALGYGGEAQLFFGADIDRFNGFYGELGFDIVDTAYDLDRFASLVTPMSYRLGFGWMWSFGSGFSLPISGGLAVMAVNTEMKAYEAGLYMTLAPRFMYQVLSDSYGLSLSVPITVQYTFNSLEVSVGVSLGGDVSFWQKERRGWS